MFDLSRHTNNITYNILKKSTCTHLIESIKTTYMENVSTGVLEEINNICLRSKDKAENDIMYQDKTYIIAHVNIQYKEDVISIMSNLYPKCSRVTLYTAGHLHTAVPHCSHSRAPIVHTAVPQENNEHGCVYLRCTAVCKLPGCVEGHPWCCLEVNFQKVDQHAGGKW